MKLLCLLGLHDEETLNQRAHVGLVTFYTLDGLRRGASIRAKVRCRRCGKVYWTWRSRP